MEQAADPESGAALIGSQRRNFVFVAVRLGMLLAALDQTVVATALPTVRAVTQGSSAAGNRSRRPGLNTLLYNAITNRLPVTRHIRFRRIPLIAR